MKFLHVMLRVKDLDRSIQFYTEALGLKLHEKKEYPKGKVTLAYLGKGQESEPFLELSYSWNQENLDWGNGFGHIAFEVKDLRETYKKIEEAGGKGIKVPSRLKDEDKFFALVEDPDSYKIELIEMKEADSDY